MYTTLITLTARKTPRSSLEYTSATGMQKSELTVPLSPRLGKGKIDIKSLIRMILSNLKNLLNNKLGEEEKCGLF
jgi:hypothetical protein